jgi:hypothetical protein
MNSKKTEWMKLDDFVHATNVARYRQMLAESSNEDVRETLRALLNEEMTRRTRKSGVATRL